MAATEEPPPRRPNPDPTSLTTDALEREVKNAKDFATDAVKHERELREQSEQAVRDKFAAIEANRIEQKRDTKENIDSAFATNAESVKNLDKNLDVALDRITVLESGLQGRMDARTAIYGTILLIIAVLGFLAANGVFSQG